jgi:uncharacterized membrane protein YfcA
MKRLKRYGKIIVFDTLAVLCFIGVILFGWLPGPGGIPLFLLGLGFLAVNHDWAERWLETAKHKGTTFKKWLFPNKRWVRNLYDVASVSGVIVGVWLAFWFEHRILQGLAVAATIFCLFVFLLNRDRFDKFSSLFKRRKA